MNLMSFLLSCLERICRIAVLLLIVVSLYNCSEEEPEPFYSNGMIKGTVYLNNFTTEHPDPANTKIIAHGPYGSSSALADSEGSFELGDLGNGTYAVEFFKEGYGRFTQYGVQVYGNDTVSLWQSLMILPDYEMPELSTVLYSSSLPTLEEHQVALVTDIPNDNYEEMQIRVFVSDQKIVSDKKYLFSAWAFAVRDAYQTQLMVFNMDSQKVAKGTKLFMIAYVCYIYDSGEFNEYYGLPVFSTVDEKQHSQVIEIIAP